MRLNCINIYEDITDATDLSPFRIEIKNREGESRKTNRLYIDNGEVKTELLPSKGLSPGEVLFGEKPVFWEPPIGLPDPDKFDPNGNKVLINGSHLPGFDYLETFMGGIEFYGLKNWGMPLNVNGTVLPLHGETSNIPVKEVEVVKENNGIRVTGSFIYRSMDKNNNKIWYLRGDELYKVSQSLFIPDKGKRFGFKTTIRNITNETLIPDWGYHITFRPEDGSRLIVPSRQAELRGGGELPSDIETWHPAAGSSVRTEVGVIHKQLYSENGRSFILLRYTDGAGIKFSFPSSPYFQTWFCNGGAGTKEFTYADGTPVLNKNWDGQGIEIGSGPVDHDGNIDNTVNYRKELEAGEKKEIEFETEFLTAAECDELEAEIIKFRKNTY